MRVLVTGGTGDLGRAVVDRLLAAGHEVRVLSRSAAPASRREVATWRGDLRDAGTLVEPLRSVEAVVHCASDVRSAVEVDVAGTGNLLRTMQDLGVPHLVHVSIVGVDRVPIRYYRAKHQVESLVAEQSVPWTIQRATQFHSFLDAMLARSARLPVIASPRGLRFQPIAVSEVASRLVDHVTTGPSGMARDLGGPEVLSHRELAETWLCARGRRRLLVPVPFPGPVGRAFRDGANLCPDNASGGVTWRDHLRRAGAGS